MANTKGFKDDSNNKAVIISGPPGIGKTTAATLIARECGYEPIEFNASDTRNVSRHACSVAGLVRVCASLVFDLFPACYQLMHCLVGRRL